METKEQILERLKKYRPQYLVDLGYKITEVDPENEICKMTFDVGAQYCHSIDIIQGGFVTAMLDSVSSHAVFATVPNIRTVSTLELKVNFYEPSRKGKIIAIGRIDKRGKNIAFLSGELYNEAGVKTASLTATAKISVLS